MAEIDMTPPAAVAREAKKGLELRERFHRGGTEVGEHRAEQLSARERLSRDDVVAMASYFARHEVDKRVDNWGDEENPSAGFVAWLLWGGEPGREWAHKVREQIRAAEEG